MFNLIPLIKINKLINRAEIRCQNVFKLTSNAIKERTQNKKCIKTINNKQNRKKKHKLLVKMCSIHSKQMAQRIK